MSGTASPAETRMRETFVDCDIHPVVPSVKSLFPYLDSRWQRHIDEYGLQQRQPFRRSSTFPKATPALSRRDSWPGNGGLPGSDLDFMRKQHLDANRIEYGVMQVMSPNATDQRNRGLSRVLCSAMNEWQLHEWARPEPRLRGSIILPWNDVPAAVAEIERVGPLKEFASVYLTTRSTMEPLGSRQFRPIFEAAVRHGLPIGIHTGGVNGLPITSGGWPSLYVEDHIDHALAMHSVMANLVFSGIFDELPGLKIVLIEGGFVWASALSWRMDQHWARFRSEVPHVTEAPSSYVRRHFWFTTQPIEEPAIPADLLEVIDWIGWDRILFSTDYPHWDSDDPRYAIKARLTPAQHRAIMGDNAHRVYRFAGHG